jgi:DNA (cytosine-5)-methyltransferase 1
LVSAQRRKRVYFIAVQSKFSKEEFIFPQLKPKAGTPMTIGEVINRDSSMSNEEKFEKFGISDKLWRSHKRRDREHAKRGNGFKSNLIVERNSKSPTLVSRYFKDGKDCLIPDKSDLAARKIPPRMLTPKECAILQTFPDDFILPESKTSAYKQMGNAVTVEVARQVSAALVKYLFD